MVAHKILALAVRVRILHRQISLIIIEISVVIRLFYFYQDSLFFAKIFNNFLNNNFLLMKFIGKKIRR